MDIVIGTLMVFLSSILELWLGIPIGLVLKLNPILIIIASSLGAICAAIIVAYFGESIRNWIIKRRSKNGNIKEGKIYDIWNKYGTVGLGLLSPFFFGAPIGATLGIALGISKNDLIKWMSIGIILWSILITAGGYFGLVVFEQTMNL